ncbi:MAG: cupin domain-containing protein [Psychrobacillus sp.]
MRKGASYYMEHLGLEPHAEGGYFRSTFASEDTLNTNGSSRKLFTSIYFLLEEKDISHLHRLKSDELWYFHGGDPLIVHVIDSKGIYHEYKLGLDIVNGETPQIIVHKNSIFGSSVSEGGAFSLVGCMVSPGFEYEDFELFTQDELLEKYPEHASVIQKLAYKNIPNKY